MRIATAALATLILAGPAAAQPLACRAAKLRAASKAVYGLLKCEEVGAKKGLPTDSACVSKATGKLAKAYASAEGKGGCAPDDGIDRLAETVRDVQSTAALRLRPTAALSKCQALKLKAAGKRARDSLKAHAKNLKKLDVAKLQLAIQKLRGKYDAAIPKAEAKGDCLTTGDAVAVAGATDAALDVVMTAVRVVERSTESRSSPVAPPETPGTPGVVTPYAKVDTVLGLGASLNNVTWTRWYLNDLSLPPDAILVWCPASRAAPATSRPGREPDHPRARGRAGGRGVGLRPAHQPARGPGRRSTSPRSSANAADRARLATTAASSA